MCDDPIELHLPEGAEVVFHSLPATLPANLAWLSEDETFIRLANGIGLDVGWYGGDDGAFRLVVFQEGDWHNQITSFRSRDPAEVAKQIEKYALKYHQTRKEDQSYERTEDPTAD